MRTAMACWLLSLVVMAPKTYAVDTKPNPPALQTSKIPNWSAVRNEVTAHFATLKEYRSGDLLSQADVQPIFARLQGIGWHVSDEKEIMELVLEDSDFLVEELRHHWGLPLVRRVAGKKLMYDRLDRISQVDGGRQLIMDVARLPDAPKAMDHLPALLPKKAGGRKRKITDYDKPTGKIYTETDFLKRLQESHTRVLTAPTAG